MTSTPTINALHREPDTDVTYLVSESDTAFSNFTGSFAWLGDNLFTGPAASYRVEDPSQRTEPEKPASFPSKRWQKLEALWNQVKGIGQLPHSTGDRKAVAVTTQAATKIVDAAIASLFGANPHQTVASDWCAKLASDSSSSKARYHIDVNVMGPSEVSQARTNDSSFGWCALEIPSSPQFVSDKYVRIIQVTGGSNAKVGCVQKNGSPMTQMNAADFVTAFHT